MFNACRLLCNESQNLFTIPISLVSDVISDWTHWKHREWNVIKSYYYGGVSPYIIILLRSNVVSAVHLSRGDYIYEPWVSVWAMCSVSRIPYNHICFTTSLANCLCCLTSDRVWILLSEMRMYSQWEQQCVHSFQSYSLRFEVCGW